MKRLFRKGLPVHFDYSWVHTSLILMICMIGVFVPNYLQAAGEIQYLKSYPTNATKALGLQWQNNIEFSPAFGEQFTIRFSLDQPAPISLDIFTADGEVIRSLLSNRQYNIGTHSIIWDGKDKEGSVVPDEAYIPVLTVHNDTTLVDDPRHYSGGEILKDLKWGLRGDTEISFSLPNPARVLVRTGIKDGPMMRELRRWKPSAAGKSVIRWDGYDKDKVEYFADREDKWTVVMAYLLPEFSIITSGNTEINYRDYRKIHGWESPTPDLTKIKLHRGGIRLSRDYFLPREYLPRVSVNFSNSENMSKIGIPIVGKTVQFLVTVPDEDRWILNSSFYETGFYIDYQFQSEEEQGFVPMVWEYDTSKLMPGRHLATVQLFGFGGFIASDSIEFLVPPR